MMRRGTRRRTCLQTRRNTIREYRLSESDEGEQEGGRTTETEQAEHDGESGDRNEPGSNPRSMSLASPEDDESRDEVQVVNESNSDGEDVEYMLATDSNDSSHSARNVSSASGDGSAQTSGSSSRFSRLSRRMMEDSQARGHFRRRRNRHRQVDEIDLVEINLDVSSSIDDDNDEVVEVDVVGSVFDNVRVEAISDTDSDSDPDIEVLQENPAASQSNVNVSAEGLGTMSLGPGSDPALQNVNQDALNFSSSFRNPEEERVFNPMSRNPVVGENVSTVGNSEGHDEESDDHDVEEGPPQKMPRLETSARSDEDDGCHICYESYDNSGGHRPCCLKCGHIFGKDCIERWIKAQKRCPDCNCKAMVKDIRIIYVKNLKAIDTAELDRMKEEIDKLKIEKNRVELTNAQLRCQVQAKTQEIERLRTENNLLISRPLKDSTEKFNVMNQEPGTSSKTMELVSASSSQYTGLRMPKLHLIKKFNIKEGQSRVGAYNEWMNLLVVSHAITSALFPSGSFGIKKINSLEMKAFQSFPIHQRPIRDMAFSPLQNELLLTVSLDKKAVLFNCSSNCTVQTFNTPSSLWSCCWNSSNQNIFYVGSVTGQVTSYDIRAPQEPLNTLFIPTSDKSGVARLKYVPAPYQNQPFNMSGLLIQKLNSVWFSEIPGNTESDARYHQLPLEGPFLNLDFEPTSRHVLVSTRPKQSLNQRTSTRHTVCDLGKTYSEAEERDVFSCDVVQVMAGGYQEATIMCRSALFSPRGGQVYVAANGEGVNTVRVWDVANVEQKALVRIGQVAALDFVHGSVNDTNFLGIIMDNALDVYDIKH